MSQALRLLFLLLLISLSVAGRAQETPPRPNILWITFEDMGRELGCYGDDYAITPRLDALARQGIRYTRAWSVAGMCAPARSTLITGMYPPGIGSQNMRSDVHLPSFIKAFPHYLRETGYYTSNHSKKDYNFREPRETWDYSGKDWREHGWRARQPDQPFFTVINFTDTHSSQIYWRGEKNRERRHAALKPEERHDPARAPVPPYYPDTPEVRGDLARYYDNATFADRLAGEVLDALEQDGLAEETIVFFFSDHGRGMPRSKSWCFQTSLRVPFIVRFPEKFKELAPAPPGGTVDRLVSFVDFAGTVLSLANITVPGHQQGHPFLGTQTKPARTHLFTFRDRMDERIELIRGVWDGRYKYIRNYYPHLPWFHEQTRDYPSTQPSYLAWHQLANAGKLEGPAALYMAHEKPREMLFDTEADPYELNNLAGQPEWAEIQDLLRRALHSRMAGIHDLGFMPESQWWTQFDLKGDTRPRHSIVRADRSVYPFARLREAAELVGLGPEAIPAQRKLLADANPALRFWGAIGLLAQREAGRIALDDLQEALKDDVPSVRGAAAEALVRLDVDTDRALAVLVAILNHPQPYVALPAANALDHLGAKARPVLSQMKAFLKRDPDPEIDGSRFPHWVLKNTVQKLTGRPLHPPARVN